MSDLDDLEVLVEKLDYRKVLDGRARNRLPFSSKKGQGHMGRAGRAAPKRADTKLRKF